jgi:hypothetical protein
MRATDGSISAEFQSVRLGLGDGLAGLAAKTRKAYWTADYFADHRFQHTGGHRPRRRGRGHRRHLWDAAHRGRRLRRCPLRREPVPAAVQPRRGRPSRLAGDPRRCLDRPGPGAGRDRAGPRGTLGGSRHGPSPHRRCRAGGGRTGALASSILARLGRTGRATDCGRRSPRGRNRRARRVHRGGADRPSHGGARPTP